MSADRAELPGLVDRFGDREVHWVHQPGGKPAVLLLGGCGVPVSRWDLVVALLADSELALLDRPGLVATPWPGTLPRLAEEVETLADLIRRVRGPVVVVAHSMAGLHAEALARLHPDLVAGLVLVDSSVEWEPKPPRKRTAWLTLARAVHGGMRVPPLRLIGSLADRVLVAAQSSRGLFYHSSTLAKSVYRSREATASVLAEQASYGQQIWDLNQIRQQTSLRSMPVVVLTAAGDGGKDWVSDQHRLAELLHGSQVIVEDSRHLMMLDRPAVVADAVRSVRAGQEARPDGGQ
jgi:pimeloyl-ACP methyl ester carboxylesterase